MFPWPVFCCDILLLCNFRGNGNTVNMPSSQKFQSDWRRWWSKKFKTHSKRSDHLIHSSCKWESLVPQFEMVESDGQNTSPCKHTLCQLRWWLTKPSTNRRPWWFLPPQMFWPFFFLSKQNLYWQIRCISPSKQKAALGLIPRCNLRNQFNVPSAPVPMLKWN